MDDILILNKSIISKNKQKSIIRERNKKGHRERERERESERERKKKILTRLK